LTYKTVAAPAKGQRAVRAKEKGIAGMKGDERIRAGLRLNGTATRIAR
jgi:hypothetical protein